MYRAGKPKLYGAILVNQFGLFQSSVPQLTQEHKYCIALGRLCQHPIFHHLYKLLTKRKVAKEIKKIKIKIKIKSTITTTIVVVYIVLS